jgi:UDP-N-acetylglucosamine acyltransferase
MAGKPLAEAKAELAAAARESDDVRAMLDFIEASQRGLLR